MTFNNCPASAGVLVTASEGSISPFPLGSIETRPVPPAALSRRSEIIQMVQGCEHELRLVQSRLGTADEQADDPHLARELAHKAKNLRLAVELWAHLTARRAQLQPRPAA